MGTNYYVRSDMCHDCGRYDEHHICKSLTMFEAKRHWSDDSEVVIDCGSWAEWRTFLLSAAVDSIWNEYGETFTPAEFISAVEGTDPARRSRQFEWMKDHRPDEISDGPGEGKDWIDADGFSFSAREFS